MVHPGEDVELTEEEFRLLRDFIHERFGLYFEDNQRPTLRSRLLGRLAGLELSCFEDYYRYLRFGPDRSEEQQRMVSHLTNNETYFYRELPQLKVFSEHMLRSFKTRKATTAEKSLRILSAGCSTGEEPYTLAMVIHDSAQFFWNWTVNVVGMDVDQRALEKARKGVYYHNSFRSMPPGAEERHFVREGSGASVKDSIRRLVHFRWGNITDPASYDGLAGLDAVFCRNVLIYFSDRMIRKVIGLLHQALVPGGYLFLGHAESLSRITDLFASIRFQGAMVYQKPFSPESAGGEP